MPNDAQRAPATSAATIETTRPTNGGRIPIDSVTFGWRPVPGAMTYHLFVTDSRGAPVYNRTTSDTMVGPITDAHLSRGSRYFWYVDALRNDGSSVTSRPIGFFIQNR